VFRVVPQTGELNKSAQAPRREHPPRKPSGPPRRKGEASREISPWLEKYSHHVEKRMHEMGGRRGGQSIDRWVWPGGSVPRWLCHNAGLDRQQSIPTVLHMHPGLNRGNSVLSAEPPASLGRVSVTKRKKGQTRLSWTKWTVKRLLPNGQEAKMKTRGEHLTTLRNRSSRRSTNQKSF